MTRVCLVCEHPDRAKLDRELARGVSPRNLAAVSGVSQDSLRRHRANHLPVKVVQREVLREARDTLDVGRLLAVANGAAVEVLQQARADKRPDLVLRAVDRIVSTLLLQVRITEAVDAAELGQRLQEVEAQLDAVQGVNPWASARMQAEARRN